MKTSTTGLKHEQDTQWKLLFLLVGHVDISNNFDHTTEFLFKKNYFILN